MPRPVERKWGYADREGRLVVPATYDEAARFRDGLAPVARDKRWGFVDTSGREVIPLQYTYVQRFSDGLAVVGVDTGKSTGLDTLGPGRGQRTPVTANRYGFIDRNGQPVIPARFDWARPFQEGVAQVSLTLGSPRCVLPSLWGLIDASGRLRVPIEHCHVGPAIDGLVRVVYEQHEPNQASVGFVDRDGRIVVPRLPYDFAGERWHEDRLVVRKGDRWGFVDRDAREVVPPRYESASSFHGGRARVFGGGRWGFIDSNGAMAIPQRYDAAEDFDQGLAAVRTGEAMTFVDRDGKVVLAGPFDWSPERRWSEGLRATNHSGKWGFVDRKGSFAIAPQFDDAWNFAEARAAVAIGGRWGFVDRAGRIAIGPKYFRIDEGFIDGFAKVTIREPDPRGPGLYRFVSGYIDPSGREFFEQPAR